MSNHDHTLNFSLLIKPPMQKIMSDITKMLIFHVGTGKIEYCGKKVKISNERLTLSDAANLSYKYPRSCFAYSIN